MNADGPPGAPSNPYSPPAVAIDAVGFQPVASTSTFTSTTPLAKAITLIFGIDMLTRVICAVNAVVTIEVMGRVLASAPYEDSELSAIDTRNMALVVLSSVVSILAVVWFCMFMVRANRNARSFGSPMSIRPGWAAGFFFVPVVMLWKPYQAMKEIWQGSDPDPNVSAFSASVSSLLGWWWALYLLRNFGAQVVRQVSKKVNGPKDFIHASWAEIVASGLSIAAALLAIAVVRAVARRQDERQTRQHGGAAAAL
jgi:drug/metabolite transporter (DMT)-like permease